MKQSLLIILLLGCVTVLRASEIPEEADLKSMTKISLISFGDAVKTKDFSKFYDDIADIWQQQTTAEKLKDSFKSFFDKEIDLAGAIEGKEVIFNHPAAIDADGVLIIQGYYATKPNRIVFKLKYLEEDEDWKLVGIDVNLKE